jgi:hypothetical protein
MEWFNFQRDKAALAVLVLAVVMIVAGLTGSYQMFGYCVALFIGVLAGVGFARRGDAGTLFPPVLATLVLLISLAGAFAYQSVPVMSPDDTVLGFQKGTAFVIYGVWIPAFFTLGLTFVFFFERLGDRPSSGKDVR